MHISSLFSYLGLIGIAILSIFLVSKLYAQYRLKYLFYYMLSIVFFYVFNFLDIIANYLTLGILNSRIVNSNVFQSINLISSLIALPFIIIGWFFLIKMVFSILGKPIKRLFAFIYIIFQIIMIIFFAFTINNFFKTADLNVQIISSKIVFIFNLINYFILCLVFFQLFKNKKCFKDDLHRRGFQIFASLYITSFLIYFFFVHIILSVNVLCYGYPIIAFFMHLPPLIFLFFFLKKYYRESPALKLNVDEMANFFAKYKISEREKEIIDLVLKGQSNKDIGDILFISIKTVKTHIYNIYKKLKISNRFQLINIIHNTQLDGDQT